MALFCMFVSIIFKYFTYNHSLTQVNDSRLISDWLLQRSVRPTLGR
jgi:hypothetical protein